MGVRPKWNRGIRRLTAGRIAYGSLRKAVTQGVCTFFPSRTRGGGRRFQSGANRLARPLGLGRCEEPGEVAAVGLGPGHLGPVECQVVAHVEREPANRNRLPELDRQLVLEALSIGIPSIVIDWVGSGREQLGLLLRVEA